MTRSTVYSKDSNLSWCSSTFCEFRLSRGFGGGSGVTCVGLGVGSSVRAARDCRCFGLLLEPTACSPRAELSVFAEAVHVHAPVTVEIWWA